MPYEVRDEIRRDGVRGLSILFDARPGERHQIGECLKPGDLANSESADIVDGLVRSRGRLPDVRHWGRTVRDCHCGRWLLRMEPSIRRSLAAVPKFPLGVLLARRISMIGRDVVRRHGDDRPVDLPMPGDRVRVDAVTPPLATPGWTASIVS